MDDENAKEENHQPSSSKKESQRDSEKDLYDGKREYEERGKYDRHDDGVSVSESFTTGSDSVKSRIDTADVNPEIPKPPMEKGKREKPKRKKRGKRRNGRVEKRRSLGRRQVFRRAPKRRLRERKEIRDLSVSTIFTSSSRILGCKHCGHRCCRRR
ncbi:uncharacterized protein LOC116413080 [Galleria mellonella]|uniref:Uncharacterized protein LOC116413080 n=1 Tax=Galleria mellonella TaxID=7137 RepID=A0A6J3C273_GALME|nr:uncharacterized protein LOC116413080 [Galleria mellonella]